MSNPFAFISAINEHNPSVMTDETEKDYSAYLTNRAFSYHIDSVLYANEMNSRGHLDPQMQFAFYLNSLPKKKRFSKWHKKENEEAISLISEYFSVSLSKAREIKTVISEDDYKLIVERLNKGGANNEKRRTAR